MICPNIIEIDLGRPLVRKNVGELMASGDKEANRFGVIAKVNGQEADLTGFTVYGYIILPNDETLRIKGVVDGNTAYIDVKEAGYVYDGAVVITVKLISDTFKRAVAIFDGRIAKTETENVVDGNRVVYDVDKILTLIDQMEQAESQANDAAENANTAANSAISAAESANNAASESTAAAQNASNAASYIQNATFTAEKLFPDATPTINTSTVDGHLHAVFGIPQGEKGEQGSPYTIKGRAYASVAELAADVTNPAEGDQYNVGSSAPYNIYRWTGSAWEDQGQLKGAKGDKGDSPVVGVDYFTAEDKQEIVADVLASLPNASGVLF